jgi:hypothetical protein
MRPHGNQVIHANEKKKRKRIPIGQCVHDGLEEAEEKRKRQKYYGEKTQSFSRYLKTTKQNNSMPYIKKNKELYIQFYTEVAIYHFTTAGH